MLLGMVDTAFAALFTEFIACIAVSAGVASYYAQANTRMGSSAKSAQSKAVSSYANVAGGIAQAVKYTFSQVNYVYTTSAKGVNSAANAVARIPGNISQFVRNDVKRMGEELSESHARRLEQRWIKATESYLNGIKKTPANAPVIWGHQDNARGTTLYQVISPTFGFRTFEGNRGTIVYTPSNNESTTSEKRTSSTIASAYDAAKAAVSATPSFFSKIQASVVASVTNSIKGISETLEEAAKANLMLFPPDSGTTEKQPSLKVVPPKVSESDKIKQEIEKLSSSIPEKLLNGRYDTRKERKEAGRISRQIEILESGLAKRDALSRAARTTESAIRKPQQRLRA